MFQMVTKIYCGIYKLIHMTIKSRMNSIKKLTIIIQFSIICRCYLNDTMKYNLLFQLLKYLALCSSNSTRSSTVLIKSFSN